MTRAPAETAEDIGRQLDANEQRRQRWQGVLDTRERIANNRGLHAEGVLAVADDLDREGRRLIVEAATDQLSTMFQLAASGGPIKSHGEKLLRQAGALIEHTGKAIADGKYPIDERPPTWGEYQAKMLALARFSTELSTKANLRNEFQGFLQLAEGGTKAIDAAFRKDSKPSDYWEALESLSEGTRTLTMLYLRHQRGHPTKDLVAVLESRRGGLLFLANVLPTATLWTRLGLALAKASMASYASIQGHMLRGQAADMRASNERALVALSRLVGKAHAEIKDCDRTEAILRDRLERLHSRPETRLRVPPTERFIQEGRGRPLPNVQASTPLQAIAAMPAMIVDRTEFDRRQAILAEQERIQREREAKRRDRAERASQRAMEVQASRDSGQAWTPSDTATMENHDFSAARDAIARASNMGF